MKLAQKLALNYFRARLSLLAAFSKKRAAYSAFDLFCTPLRKPKMKRAPVFDKAERLSFKQEGLTVKGYRWNHNGGKKVLIVHGFESTARNFDRYVTPLIKKGYEVIAFDAPAHGGSGGKRINLPMYVETIREINRLYGPVKSFMGHSFGGLTLAHFLETVEHDQDTRVALIAPATETSSAIDTFFTVLQLDEKVRKEFDKLIFEKGGVWPDHYSIRRAMNNIHASVIWFHDENDDLTPLEDAIKVKDDGHENLEFVTTKGLGHRRIYRENKVMKKVVEFL